MQDLERSLSSRSVIDKSGLTVYFHPQFPHNIGHALFDGIYPAFVTAMKFGQHERSFRPLYTHDVGDCPNVCMSDGVYKTFGGSGEAMRLDELEADSRLHPDSVWRFEEMLVGIGRVGNLVQDASGAVAGSQMPMNAMAQFRKRMYKAYDVPFTDDGGSSADVRGIVGEKQKVNLMVVENRRFTSDDRSIFQAEIKRLNDGGQFEAELVDWTKVGQGEDKFRAHLQRVLKADVYVTSPGTALQYVPFMRDGTVFINMGSALLVKGRAIPSFMEQQLAGGGTPYMKTLYADPGRMFRTGNWTRGANNWMEVHKENWLDRTSTDAEQTSRLFSEAGSLVRKGFRRPVSIEENLSPEGKIMVEMCKDDPSTCAVMQHERFKSIWACMTDLWPEFVVYEVGGYSEADGNCTVNRPLLRKLRKEGHLPDYMTF
jgi:hypothetical protein